MTLSITILCYYAEWHIADCHILFTIMLNVILLSVILRSIVMLSVVAPTNWQVDKNVRHQTQLLKRGLRGCTRFVTSSKNVEIRPQTLD
jgi:hypothetical protein